MAAWHSNFISHISRLGGGGVNSGLPSVLPLSSNLTKKQVCLQVGLYNISQQNAIEIYVKNT